MRWAGDLEEVIWLDGNHSPDPYSSFDALLAVGAAETLVCKTEKGALDALDKFVTKAGDWLFGYLSYDLKNDIENLASNNFDGLNFPALQFIRPKKIIRLRGRDMEFLYLDSEKDLIATDYHKILNYAAGEVDSEKGRYKKPQLQPRFSQAEYLQNVQVLQNHIQRGDIYEINFCQEFYAENAQIHPWQTFIKLNQISSSPFAAFLSLGDTCLISASPERFLKKTGKHIISQPMKGTAARSENEEKDRQAKFELETDPKERAENIMIVDLVRNDLSRHARPGTVIVRELCKVYSFPQVHQMISTVEAEELMGTTVAETLRATFPMGSMTGAPKLSAMKLIESSEKHKRGIFSGAVGYFDPEGGFDFNVVIRSILYNRRKKYLSISVGSAITAASLPEKEYEECLLKARALRAVLE